MTTAENELLAKIKNYDNALAVHQKMPGVRNARDMFLHAAQVLSRSLRDLPGEVFARKAASYQGRVYTTSSGECPVEVIDPQITFVEMDEPGEGLDD